MNAPDVVAGSAPQGVAVIARSPLIRAGLEAAIALAPGFVFLGAVVDAAEIDDMPVAPQILVVDLAEANAAEPWQSIRASGVPLVVLSDSPPRQWLECLRLGGIALLPRHAEAAEIQAALTAVVAGLTVLTGPISAELLDSDSPLPSSSDTGETERLTNRELAVLELLAEGLPNKSIAQRLAVSEHTAKFHVRQILGKLGATSRTEAVAVALRRGLVGL